MSRQMATGRLVSTARVVGCAIAFTLIAASRCPASATVTASSPYSSQADSTLNINAPTYYLEDFEDGALNIPGVTYTAVAGSGIGLHDSVDGDDGAIDGNGFNGHQFDGATSAFIQSTTFFFSPVAGQWPKQVAIAVTAGNANSLSFAAYDLNNNPSGSYTTSVALLDPSADDFLVTFIDNGGISAIAMTSNSAQTYIHYDHLQFDTALATISPEPCSAAMLLAAPVLALTRRRCHR